MFVDGSNNTYIYGDASNCRFSKDQRAANGLALRGNAPML